MIVARITDPDKPRALIVLMILEPGNVVKMKNGEPISKELTEYGGGPLGRYDELHMLIAYTTDIKWLFEEFRRIPKDQMSAARLVELAEQGRMTRPEVVRMEADSDRDMPPVKVFDHDA
jgi:hypothetical protein